MTEREHLVYELLLFSFLDNSKPRCTRVKTDCDKEKRRNLLERSTQKGREDDTVPAGRAHHTVQRSGGVKKKTQLGEEG
jgi:hypothetical protein